MQLRKLIAAASATLAIVLIGMNGCATSSAVASGEQLNVQFNVNNNLQGISGVTIYLASQSGGRRSLGPIETGQRRSFPRALRAGDYQLVATRLSDDDIMSERFRIDTDNLVVSWVLAQNQLTFATSGEE